MFLALGGAECLVHIVREEMIVGEPFLEHRTAHKLSVEEQSPAVVYFAQSVICLANDLTWRSRCQRAF